MKLIFTLICGLLVNTVSAQFPNTPQTPQPTTFNRYDNFGGVTPTPNTNGQVQMGATANDINRRQSQQSQTSQGSLTDQQRIERERREYQEILKETDADFDRIERARLIASELDTTFGNPPVINKDKYEATKSFWNALVVLTDMGNGKRKFSITEAIYTVENAYFQGRLSKEKFYQAIQVRADLCKQILKREKLNPDDNLAKNYAIQKLYQQNNEYYNSQTGQTIKVPKLEYDFTDYMGDSSHAQMFVSKLMATGKGQCHSMPLMFLSIAEQLGAKANLSLAPEHSFIRFSDGEDGMYNFESTNGYIVSDNWMLQSGYISTAAIKNKIYLDTLSEKQLLALCMIDLAMGYEYDYGYDGFTEQALKYALPLDPNGIQGHIMLSNLWAAKTKKAINYFNLPSLEALQRNPIASTLQKRMLSEYNVIDGLGYQQMPKEAYQMWLQSVNEQKEKQDQQQLQQRMQYLLRNSKTKLQIKKD